jgi:tRNA threonylcarbamoyladenosine biosynthesis protein TsaB
MELNLLALETSSSCCSVALLRGGDAGMSRVIALEHEGSQEHAERLLLMVSQLLSQEGLRPEHLHAVVFGQGPGGFTGLRVACGVAQGVGLALEIPVLPVVSHQAVAQQTKPQSNQAVVVALDARMNEVYLAAYRMRQNPDTHPAWEVLQKPTLIAASEVALWTAAQLDAWSRGSDVELSPLLAGDAWDVYGAAMHLPSSWPRAAILRPDAQAVARLAEQMFLQGKGELPEHVAPLYVRDKVAFTTLERQQGEGGNPKAAPSLVGLSPQAMSLADLDDVSALEADVQSSSWTRGNFADALSAGYGAWVLRQNGRLLGFSVVMFAPDVTHLLVIAVAPDQQRRGLGSVLLEWCEKQAQERQTGGLLLEVRPSNVGALTFYERRNFLHIGVRRGYYQAENGQREDALVMQKLFSDQTKSGDV